MDKNKHVDLGIALEKKLINIDDIIARISNKDMAMDGGSIVAISTFSDKVANVEFNIIKCNKKYLVTETNEIKTIKDIYIGDFMLDDVCQ